jgi:hypothetical protein
MHSITVTLCTNIRVLTKIHPLMRIADYHNLLYVINGPIGQAYSELIKKNLTDIYEKFLLFAAGRHSRIGTDSSVKYLPLDIMEVVYMQLHT